MSKILTNAQGQPYVINNKVIIINSSPTPVITPNYTVMGSPTISDDYILSGISANDYLTTNISGLPSNGFDVIIKLKYISNSDQSPFFGINSTQDWCGIWNSNTAGMWFHSDIRGSANVSNNDIFWYLLRATANGYEVYILIDNDEQYTVDTLPAISSWTQSATSSSTGIITNGAYTIGKNPDSRYGSQYWRGDIYLDSFVIKNTSAGTVYWSALTES